MVQDHMAQLTENLLVQSVTKQAMFSRVEMLVVLRLEADGESAPGSPHSGNNHTAGLLPLETPQYKFSVANITITIFASLVIFCTLAGNALVIAAVVKEKRLRKVSNSFIISLAVSDLLVGILVTPLALVYQLYGHWIFSSRVCDFWVFVDVICCTASITNLCAISYDRYNAITEPLRYARKRTCARAVVFIVVVWTYSLFIALPPFAGWAADKDEVDDQQCTISQSAGYTLYSTIGAFYLPLFFMLFAYICIYRETSKRTRRWKRGPGSSKMISERDRLPEVMNIRMVQLGKDDQVLSSNWNEASCAGTGNGIRRASGSGAFLKNSSLGSRHSDNVIIEVDESTRKEISSVCSSTISDTPILQAAGMAAPSPGTVPSPAERERRSPKRSYGSCPRKLIRQISNLPSSDSSTVTSTSSIITTSSSDHPPDHVAFERRFSSAITEQNTLYSNGDRAESMTKPSDEKVSRTHRESSRKSVTFFAPSLQMAAESGKEVEREVLSVAETVKRPSQAAQSGDKRKDRGLRHKRRKISVSQERRAAKTLGVVLGCFIVCWMPFFLLALLKPLCSPCRVPAAVDGVVLWLGYTNSALNPVIYTFFNNDFRFAFQRVLRCPCGRRRAVSL